MSLLPASLRAYRASLLHFHADPAFAQDSHVWHEDGLLIVGDGVVVAAGDYTTLKSTIADDVEIVDYH